MEQIIGVPQPDRDFEKWPQGHNHTSSDACPSCYNMGKREGLQSGRLQREEEIVEELKGWMVDVPRKPLFNVTDEDMNQLFLYIGRTNYNKAIQDVINHLTKIQSGKK